MKEVLDKLSNGEISVEQAEKLLRIHSIEEIGNMAKIDTGRETRKGIPEIILGEGKTPRNILEITRKVLKTTGRVIISRVQKNQISIIKKNIPDNTSLHINSKANIIVLRKDNFKTKKTGGKIGILTAGSSDIPIAEEAKVIAEEMGCEVISTYDVGVAGIHRLFPRLKEMIEKNVDVIVAVAGREGALPSVIAGIIDVPLIAIPTSIGYGLGEKGIGALIAMLQSCSLGIAVVNIDGGVSAGTIAALIANRVSKARKRRKT